MAERVTLTCDRTTKNQACGEPAHTYIISGPEGEWKMDLCDKHAEPIYGPFKRDGMVPAKEGGVRRTVTDTARPFFEDR